MRSAPPTPAASCTRALSIPFTLTCAIVTCSGCRACRLPSPQGGIDRIFPSRFGQCDGVSERRHPRPARLPPRTPPCLCACVVACGSAPVAELPAAWGAEGGWGCVPVARSVSPSPCPLLAAAPAPWLQILSMFSCLHAVRQLLGCALLRLFCWVIWAGCVVASPPLVCPAARSSVPLSSYPSRAPCPRRPR